MSKVYVVLSEVIYRGECASHGMHGVYSTRDGAKTTAISAITSIAQRYNHNITVDDIYVDNLEFNYQSGNLEIYTSCIKQEVL